MATEDRELAIMLAVHERNARVLEAFWGWRHELLALGLSGIALSLALVGLLPQEEAGWLAPFASLVAVAIATTGICLVRRNRQILDISFETAV